MDRNQVVPGVFGVKSALIGVVHLQALPGTPRQELGLEQTIDRAVEEARSFEQAGFHAVVIENMHDRPYIRRSTGPEIVAAMTASARTVADAIDIPIGVQVLAGANRQALAVALASGAAFVRVEGFVFAHVADEGVMEAEAAELLRYRRTIGAEHVRVFADVKKKHSSHAMTADVDLVETAKAAEFFLADGVVVTGSATGSPANPEEVESVHEQVGIPTLVGSGVTPENVARFARADGLIVGSALKVDGLWSNPLDSERLEAMVRAFSEVSRRA